MLTTRQARTLIRKYEPRAEIWTNKVKDPAVRHVKFYDHGGNSVLIAELQKLGGETNVSFTDCTTNYAVASGVIVRCQFE